MSGAPPAMGAEEHESNENNSQKDTSEEQEIASQKKEMKIIQRVGRF